MVLWVAIGGRVKRKTFRPISSSHPPPLLLPPGIVKELSVSADGISCYSTARFVLWALSVPISLHGGARRAEETDPFYGFLPPRGPPARVRKSIL